VLLEHGLQRLGRRVGDFEQSLLDARRHRERR
jgi:hypothetical protein